MKITGEIAYRVFIAFIVVLGLAIAGSYIYQRSRKYGFLAALSSRGKWRS